jgi:putative membrane protein
MMWRYGLGWLGHQPLAWIGPVIMGLFWIAIIVGIVFLVLHLARRERTRSRTDSAMEVLKQRYARGEISKEEFAEKKRDLS